MRVLCKYLTCTLAFLVGVAGLFSFAWNLVLLAVNSMLCFMKYFNTGEFEVISGWSHVVIFIITYLVIASGITVGFHRYATHRSFEFIGLGKWLVRPLFLIAGSLGFQGNMDIWTLVHKNHHHDTEGPGDPHSPYCPNGSLIQKIRQFLWSHMMWIPHFNPREKRFSQWSKFDWLEKLITRLYLPIVLIPLALVWLCFGWNYLADFLGAIFICWNVTASVNSVCHLFGHRPFKTGDHSGNIFWWLVWISLGEWLHHNHHKSQKSACFARTRWEYIVDIGWHQICLMRMLGLVRLSSSH